MDTRETRRDRWFAGGMVVLSLALMARSFTYPADSAVFPRFLSVVLLALSALLVVNLLRQPVCRAAPAAALRRSPADWLRHPGLFVFGALAAYTLAMQQLGFMISTILFMAACMRRLGSRRWSVTLAWSVGFPVCAYLLFHTFLGLQLPRGFWQ